VGQREEVYTEMKKIINSTGKFLLSQFSRVREFLLLEIGDPLSSSGIR
jgi:hypothetical protein